MARDVLAPRSRHNRHVTTPSDIEAVGEWRRDQLFAAVEAADERAAVVVIDYGRTALYLAAPAGLAYEPPQLFGIRQAAALHVADPVRFDPEREQTSPVSADDGEPPAPPARLDPTRVVVTVSPSFDLLVPAFDWDEQPDDDTVPPLSRRPSQSPAGTPG